MRFYFIRHGESQHNADGLFCGSINSPLTAKGVAQGQAAATALEAVDLDWIVSSPLQRATRTAAWVASSHGLRVETDPRLSEHAKGVLEGTPHVKKSSASWAEVEGAESMTMLYRRVHAALIDLGDREGTGVVVAHAGVARAVEAIGLLTDPAGLYDLKKASNGRAYLVELSYPRLLSADPIHAVYRSNYSG